MLSGGEVQSIFHLWVSPSGHFLILRDRVRHVPQFCLLLLLLKGDSDLSDVHHGHPHTEPLHLEPEEQGHAGVPEEICQQVFFPL